MKKSDLYKTKSFWCNRSEKKKK